MRSPRLKVTCGLSRFRCHLPSQTRTLPRGFALLLLNCVLLNRLHSLEKWIDGSTENPQFVLGEQCQILSRLQLETIQRNVHADSCAYPERQGCIIVSESDRLARFIAAHELQGLSVVHGHYMHADAAQFSRT